MMQNFSMVEDKIYDIAVVGGGIVGAATAYKVQRQYPDLKIILIEKEDRLADHQTGNNSGVIHSGLYYKPGSYKAKNCVTGRRELVKFAQEHNIPHDVCGKVVVAVDESEMPFLEKIYSNGVANDTEGIRKITGDEVREIEPFCTGIAGIHVPCTGIIDFRATTEKLCELVSSIQPDSKIVLGEEVLSYEREDGVKQIKTSKNQYKANRMIFCGGLQSDRLARKDGVDLEMRIVGFRGDYYELTEQAMHKVKNLIYPVPNPAFPFLGVHFTRMIHGGVECGPNAVFTFKREGYDKTDFSLKDTAEALSYSGTWKLLFNHFGFAVNEYRRAFSKRRFLKTLQRLIPSLEMEDIEPGRAGVRAMALGADGEMIEDFRIECTNDDIHILNAPSPAATAALAIGEEVRRQADSYFKLESMAQAVSR